MQTQLSGAQLTFSSFFPAHPAPTATAQQASGEFNGGIIAEIEEKQERISELLKETGGTEEDIAIAEADELEFEPDRGEEEIYSSAVPRLEEELTYLRAENEEQIRDLESEIEFLEAKLK